MKATTWLFHVHALVFFRGRLLARDVALSPCSLTSMCLGVVCRCRDQHVPTWCLRCVASAGRMSTSTFIDVVVVKRSLSKIIEVMTFVTLLFTLLALVPSNGLTLVYNSMMHHVCCAVYYDCTITDAGGETI